MAPPPSTAAAGDRAAPAGVKQNGTATAETGAARPVQPVADVDGLDSVDEEEEDDDDVDDEDEEEDDDSQSGSVRSGEAAESEEVSVDDEDDDEELGDVMPPVAAATTAVGRADVNEDPLEDAISRAAAAAESVMNTSISTVDARRAKVDDDEDDVVDEDEDEGDYVDEDEDDDGSPTNDDDGAGSGLDGADSLEDSLGDVAPVVVAAAPAVEAAAVPAEPIAVPALAPSSPAIEAVSPPVESDLVELALDESALAKTLLADLAPAALPDHEQPTAETVSEQPAVAGAETVSEQPTAETVPEQLAAETVDEQAAAVPDSAQSAAVPAQEQPEATQDTVVAPAAEHRTTSADWPLPPTDDNGDDTSAAPAAVVLRPESGFIVRRVTTTHREGNRRVSSVVNLNSGTAETFVTIDDANDERATRSAEVDESATVEAMEVEAAVAVAAADVPLALATVEAPVAAVAEPTSATVADVVEPPKAVVLGGSGGGSPVSASLAVPASAAPATTAASLAIPAVAAADVPITIRRTDAATTPKARPYSMITASASVPPSSSGAPPGGRRLSADLSPASAATAAGGAAGVIGGSGTSLERRASLNDADKIQAGPDGERRRTRLAAAFRRPSNTLGTEATAVPRVGTSVDVNHRNYVLMYDMLNGIRVTVSRCQAKPGREPVASDFTAAHKLAFDITGNELTPSSKYDFKFKDYAPWVFRKLREHFHIDASDYLVTLTSRYVLSELGSPGKSGSFFYFSSDYRFIIKTIAPAEHRFFRSILQQYYNYVLTQPNTLLVRFYGLHRVKLPRGRKIHYVVMENVFPPNRDMHETYDLKGSTVGRYTEPKPGKTSILKDNNFLENHRKLRMGPAKRTVFLEQIKRDSEAVGTIQFLATHNIMDYSLLVGIHNMDRGNRDELRNRGLTVVEPKTLVQHTTSDVATKSQRKAIRKAIKRSDPVALRDAPQGLPEASPEERMGCIFYADGGGFQATDDNDHPLQEVYHMGVIDILTPYDIKKRIEHGFKSLTHDRNMISAVNARQYAARFVQFLSTATLSASDPDSDALDAGNDLGPSESMAAMGVPPSSSAPMVLVTAAPEQIEMANVSSS